MNCFHLYLKEQGEDLKSLVGFCEEGEKSQKPSEIFRKVEEKFSSNLVDGNPENQPFLYMNIVPVRKEGSNFAASITPTACFKIGVKEEIIKFINDQR